jgi:hypothetical protein
MQRADRDRLEELLVRAVIAGLESSEGPPAASLVKVGLDLLLSADRGALNPRPTADESRKAMLDALAREGKALPFPSVHEEQVRREPPKLLREE